MYIYFILPISPLTKPILRPIDRLGYGYYVALGIIGKGEGGLGPSEPIGDRHAGYPPAGIPIYGGI
jgi:hypothetical protein